MVMNLCSYMVSILGTTWYLRHHAHLFSKPPAPTSPKLITFGATLYVCQTMTSANGFTVHTSTENFRQSAYDAVPPVPDRTDGMTIETAAEAEAEVVTC